MSSLFRRSRLRLLAGLLLLALVFFIGLVVGRAVERSETSAGSQEIVRTLKVDTALVQTVTVTVTAP